MISQKLSVPNAERIFFIRQAPRAGLAINEIFNLTKIDHWVLVQIKEIVDFEEELAGEELILTAIPFPLIVPSLCTQGWLMARSNSRWGETGPVKRLSIPGEWRLPKSCLTSNNCLTPRWCG